jgi:hypothetical protein
LLYKSEAQREREDQDLEQQEAEVRARAELQDEANRAIIRLAGRLESSFPEPRRALPDVIDVEVVPATDIEVVAETPRSASAASETEATLAKSARRPLKKHPRMIPYPEIVELVERFHDQHKVSYVGIAALLGISERTLRRIRSTAQASPANAAQIVKLMGKANRG